MRHCTYSESLCYDPTQEFMEECGRAAVGECGACEMYVCLGHSELCACGEIFCDDCRAMHQAECEAFKLELYLKTKKYAEPLTR